MLKKTEEKLTTRFTSFDFVNAIVGKSEFEPANEDSFKDYQAFLINRIISMNTQYLMVVNEMNMFPCPDIVPKRQHFMYYDSFIPKKNQFFEYIKKNKTDEDTEEYIEKYFECGSRDRNFAMKMLSDDQKSSIVEKYSERKVLPNKR
jgi:hypothetical protein